MFLNVFSVNTLHGNTNHHYCSVACLQPNQMGSEDCLRLINLVPLSPVLYSKCTLQRS